jgi:hypothetical protein
MLDPAERIPADPAPATGYKRGAAVIYVDSPEPPRSIINPADPNQREILPFAKIPGRPATVPVDSIPDQIKKLAELRDAGILTEEEFSRKKTELMARI